MAGVKSTNDHVCGTRSVLCVTGLAADTGMKHLLAMTWNLESWSEVDDK